jgi:hypothetical protein
MNNHDESSDIPIMIFYMCILLALGIYSCCGEDKNYREAEW